VRFKPVLLTAAMAAAGLVLAPAASAQPNDNPCTFAVNFFCQFIPMAPDLEGDIDLTTELPAADPNLPPPPPVDPCINGCI